MFFIPYETTPTICIGVPVDVNGKTFADNSYSPGLSDFAIQIGSGVEGALNSGDTISVDSNGCVLWTPAEAETTFQGSMQIVCKKPGYAMQPYDVYVGPLPASGNWNTTTPPTTTAIATAVAAAVPSSTQVGNAAAAAILATPANKLATNSAGQVAAARLGSGSLFADAGQTVLVPVSRSFTLSVHTQDPSAAPSTPAPIDGAYNGSSGMPYVTVLQDGAPVDSTLVGLYVEHSGCWGIVVNPLGNDPQQDLAATGIANRYDVQFTPNSSQSGLFQIVAIAQVNGCEQAVVIATVQVGPVAAAATNLPSDYLSSEEQLQLSTLTNGTFGNAALLGAIEARGGGGGVSITTENTVINSN